MTGTLTYLPSTSPLPQACANGNCSGLNVAAFASGAANVVTEPATLYLSDIDVPTENFTNGFPDSSGSLLTNESGSPLIEYFSLRLRTDLMLNQTDTAGDYQLAVLSDDGSILWIDPTGSGTFQELIDNDGARANTLGCAPTTVHLVPGVPLSVKLDYFQGPRYSIAFILMWRPVTSSPIPSEPECGVEQNDGYYFDESTTPSTPTSNYVDLLRRGWSVVPAANLYLPGTATNPCATGSGS